MLSRLLRTAYADDPRAQVLVDQSLDAARLPRFPDDPRELLNFVRVHLAPRMITDVGPRLVAALLDDLEAEIEHEFAADDSSSRMAVATRLVPPAMDTTLDYGARGQRDQPARQKLPSLRELVASDPSERTLAGLGEDSHDELDLRDPRDPYTRDTKTAVESDPPVDPLQSHGTLDGIGEGTTSSPPTLPPPEAPAAYESDPNAHDLPTREMPVYVPPEALRASTPPKPPPLAPRPARPSVILVDGDRFGRASLARALVQAQCDVTVLDSASEVVTALASGEWLDVVITDVDGVDVESMLRALQRLRPTTPVIAWTRATRAVAEHVLLTANVASFEIIAKASRTSEVIELVRRFAAR